MALEDAPLPVEPRVFIRGNPNNLGEAVPRQFLGVLSGPGRRPFGDGSGRLELARAIVDPGNPLTARVLVNRVWMHHFGTPLVGTPGDFGLRSEPPTHPELLDHLATTFVKDGWSIKRLHRRIMLSHTYQQASDDRPDGRRLDPENVLYWRMNRRRLDFEATRDALLAVSGRLSQAVGGPSVKAVNRPEPPRGRSTGSSIAWTSPASTGRSTFPTRTRPAPGATPRPLRPGTLSDEPSLRPRRRPGRPQAARARSGAGHRACGSTA